MRYSTADRCSASSESYKRSIVFQAVLSEKIVVAFSFNYKATISKVTGYFASECIGGLSIVLHLDWGCC